jgi:hypothetical protein
MLGLAVCNVVNKEAEQRYLDNVDIIVSRNIIPPVLAITLQANQTQLDAETLHYLDRSVCQDQASKDPAKD